MYKYLITAGILVTISAPALAERVRERVGATYNNKMDSNNNGLVSVKEANTYGNKAASGKKDKEVVKVKKQKKTSLQKQNTKKTEEKHTDTSESLDVRPLESESSFPWSDSNKPE